MPRLRKSRNTFYAKTDTGLRAPGAKPLIWTRVSPLWSHSARPGRQCRKAHLLA